MLYRNIILLVCIYSLAYVGDKVGVLKDPFGGIVKESIACAMETV